MPNDPYPVLPSHPETTWKDVHRLRTSSPGEAYAQILYIARYQIETYLSSFGEETVATFRSTLTFPEYDPLFGNIPRIPLTTQVFYNRYHGFGKVHHGISALSGHRQDKKPSKTTSTTTQQNDEVDPQAGHPLTKQLPYSAYLMSWDYFTSDDKSKLAFAHPIFLTSRTKATQYSKPKKPYPPLVKQNPYFALHLAWDFFTIADRRSLATAHPAFRAYAQLRATALTRQVYHLSRSSPNPAITAIDDIRCDDMAIALFRSNLIYGDLIRWLGGPYTHEQRDWDAVFDIVDTVKNIPPLPSTPPSTMR